MIFSENRLPLFGIMRLPPRPGGSGSGRAQYEGHRTGARHHGRCRSSKPRWAITRSPGNICPFYG